MSDSNGYFLQPFLLPLDGSRQALYLFDALAYGNHCSLEAGPTEVSSPALPSNCASSDRSLIVKAASSSGTNTTRLCSLFCPRGAISPGSASRTKKGIPCAYRRLAIIVASGSEFGQATETRLISFLVVRRYRLVEKRNASRGYQRDGRSVFRLLAAPVPGFWMTRPLQVFLRCAAGRFGADLPARKPPLGVRNASAMENKWVRRR